MQKLTINKQDDSFSITLPKALVEKLHITENNTLLITETSDGFTLSKYDEKLEKAMEIYRQGSDKYRNALRKLA